MLIAFATRSAQLLLRRSLEESSHGLFDTLPDPDGGILVPMPGHRRHDLQASEKLGRQLRTAGPWTRLLMPYAPDHLKLRGGQEASSLSKNDL